jgi:two-component system, cell cycle response regulator
MTLGRLDADIRLPDEMVSKKHALIEALSRENIYLRDLASTNGTFLNGHQVSTSKLRDGDTLRLGSFVLRFRSQDQ